MLYFQGHLENFCDTYGFVTGIVRENAFIALPGGQMRERRWDVCVHR